MSTPRGHIQKALFFNSQGEERPVPREIILANYLSAGFEEEAINAELAEMVDEGGTDRRGGHLPTGRELRQENWDTNVVPFFVSWIPHDACRSVLSYRGIRIIENCPGSGTSTQCN